MTGRMLASITVLGLFVRLVALWVFEPTPLFGDENAFYAVAWHSAHDGMPWLTDLTMPVPIHKPPGAFFLYAGWISLFGDELRHLRLLNVAVGSLVPLLGFVLGQRIGDHRTGLLAALLLALHPNLVVYSTGLWSESLYVLALLAALVALTSETGRWSRHALAAGLLFGLATWIRETGLFLPALGLGWAAWRYRRGLPVARGVALAAIAFAVVLAPWTWRLNQEDGPTRLMSHNSSWNLYLGNTSNKPTYHQLHKHRGQRDIIARDKAMLAIQARMPWWPLNKVKTTLPRFFTAYTYTVRRIIEPPSSRWRARGRWEWTEHPALRKAVAAGVMSVESLLSALGSAGLLLVLAVGPPRRRAIAAVLLAMVALHYFPAWITFARPRFAVPCTVAFLFGAAWVGTHGASGWRAAGTGPRAAAVLMGVSMCALQVWRIGV